MKKKLDKKQIKLIVGILCGVVLIIILGLCYFIYQKNQEKKMIQTIKNHYSDYVEIKKDTILYDKSKKKVGTVKKGFFLELQKEEINKKEDIYFKVKNSDFYIHYDDVKKTKEKEPEKNEYLVFNENVKTEKKTTFYQNDKEILTINKSIDLPLEYMDDKYYYVIYLNQILQIKKEKIELKKHENTKEKESNYISIIHYPTIDVKDKCNTDTCIQEEQLKQQLNYLKENNFYTINLEEYTKWLEGKIRLKEKAILLTTTSNNDTLKNLNNSQEFKIQTIDQNVPFKFQDTNNKTTKESKKDQLSRYNIKTTTTLDNFKKMANGEEVKEILPEKVTQTANVKGQTIPVLNYHFFYDASIGEQCNENICLDITIFKQQLDYLKNNGYKTLTMEEFRKWMYGEIELPNKSVLITVDDGAMGTGKHNGNKLIPILEQYNMHATLFLISGWWDANNYRSNYLDIQSHTYDMHQYGTCGKGQVVCATKEQLIEDLQKSLSIVDNNNSFCFPFYSYSDVAIQGVKEAGFKMAFIGGYRKASRSDDKYKIPRYPIHKTTTMQQFIQMVS